MPEHIIQEISRRRIEAIEEYECLMHVAPYLMSLQSMEAFISHWLAEHYDPPTWTSQGTCEFTK